jgi:ABC-type transport system involved in multi-copper enzyme maturation permease subunit
MIAAVFYRENLHAGRRQRWYYLRWLYAAFLLAQLVPVFFLSQFGWARLLSGFDTYTFFESFLTQHYVLLALLTPAMVGGAITEEKRRGTLQYLLTTSTRPGEIILGKLCAHTYQLAILSLVGLPLFCFFAGLAGDFSFPAAVIVSSLGLAFGLAALSILFSVCCRSTRDALLCVYLLLGMGGVFASFLPSTGLGTRLLSLNPLRLLSFNDVSFRGRYLGEYLVGWLTIGLACTLVAACWLRRAYRSELQVRQRARARWWRGKHGRVRGNPVLWRTQQVEGIAPLEWLRRMPRWLGLLAALIASAATLACLLVYFSYTAAAGTGAPSAAEQAWASIREGDWPRAALAFEPLIGDAFFWHGLAALVLLTLSVVIRASGAITGEQEKGTWQALLLTPLTTQKIITGKHWGIFWACAPYVAAHAAVALPAALFLDSQPGVFKGVPWAVLWIVVLLLAIILSSALGLWCSARASSSWRSLVSTLALFYLGWLLFSLPLTFLLAFFKGVIELGLRFVGLFTDTSILIGLVGSASVAPVALCFGLAAAFWVLTHRLLASAVTRVGRNDREGGFDYYYLYHDSFRRRREEKWESPRIDYASEMEVGAGRDGSENTMRHSAAE